MSPTDTRPRAPQLPVESFRLANGLILNLVPDRSLPLVAVNLWYTVGSRDEIPGRTGLAHLFEHMLFEGSAHVPAGDHFRLVQQAGGTANASTWYDRTNYFELLPAHQLELGLWLEADRMGFLLSALDEEKLATQRRVVLNERQERIDNQPYGRAFERLLELLYPEGHPYRTPVIGYAADIEAATLEEVRSFYRRHYAPDRAVLTLAGHLNPEEARRQVERWFGDLEPARGQGRGGPPVLSATAGGREILPDRVQLPRVYIAHRIPGYATPGWYAADLLAAVLGDGKTSRLYHDLVWERELAVDVSAAVLPTELESILVVVATAAEPSGIDQLERRLLAHLERAGAGIDPGELERARNGILTGYLEALQGLGGRADLISQFTCLCRDPFRLEEEFRSYLSVEPGDLARCAATLDPETAATVVVVPEESG